MNKQPVSDMSAQPTIFDAKRRFGYAVVSSGLAVFALLACSPTDDPGDGDGASGGMTGASGGATGASGGETGASGGATGSGGASDPSQLPTDTSQAGIEAFIAAGTYKNWVHDPMPRDTGSLAAHGHLLQVYFNALAVAAGDQGEPVAGRMIVKELYDEATGQLAGTAVNIRTEGPKNWIYYCTNPGGVLCGVSGAPEPLYDANRTEGCQLCHGNVVLAHLPE